MDADFSIYTKLDVMPKPKKPELAYIIRGTTGYFKFNLQGKTYGFDDIDQATFIFKQNNTLYSFELYDIDPELQTKELNYHFTHEVGRDYDYIKFRLTVDDTLDFKATGYDFPMQYEVAIKLNSEDTITEEQFPVVVKDSLYGELLDSKRN